MREAVEEAQRAVMQVIETESIAYLNRDYETWARCWVHAPHVRRWGFSGPGGIYARGGWEEQGARMKQFMAANPAPSTAEYRREALNLRVGRDMAWVTFEQYASGGSRPEADLPEASDEIWILEKDAEGWKIACICVFRRSLEHITSALVSVDREAVVTWMNAAADHELRTFRGIAVRGGRLRAVDRAVDQRLQAAIRWAGHLDDGVTPRHGTLPIVVDGGRGEPANVCWVIGHSSQILVAINNQRMTEERLAAAVVVYGITPAQTRLAGLIIAGHDLVDAADRLGVSANTTRTHLQRMFEKTGVRSQPALVRALLSVASPLG